jgi:hypothetical protein
MAELNCKKYKRVLDEIIHFTESFHTALACYEVLVYVELICLPNGRHNILYIDFDLFDVFNIYIYIYISV